jgi:hypothetical protein
VSERPSESLLDYVRVVMRCMRCRDSVFVKVDKKDLNQLRALLPGTDGAAHVRKVPWFCHECAAGDVLVGEAIRQANPRPATEEHPE